jgi:hypothetical protein
VKAATIDFRTLADYSIWPKDRQQVPRVRIGMVAGLEMCPEWGLGLWLVLARIN